MARLFPCSQEQANPNPSPSRRGMMKDATAEPEDHEPPGDETGPKLSRRQIMALPILAAAPNLTEGAKEAGISDATLYRWRQNAHFRAEMDLMTHEIAETTREGLNELLHHSFRVIGEMLKDPDPAVRLRAAQATIIYGIRVCKAEEYRQGIPDCEVGPPEDGKAPRTDQG